MQDSGPQQLVLCTVTHGIQASLTVSPALTDSSAHACTVHLNQRGMSGYVIGRYAGKQRFKKT